MEAQVIVVVVVVVVFTQSTPHCALNRYRFITESLHSSISSELHQSRGGQKLLLLPMDVVSVISAS